LLSALDDWNAFIRDVGTGAAFDESEISRDELEHAGPALRRTWQALYASSYGNRAVRVHQNAQDVPAFSERRKAPLMYQGASDFFLGPYEAISIASVDDELDAEAELAVVTDYVPQSTKASDAHHHVRLIVMINDFTYRALVRQERERRFGFVQAKPTSAMSSIACTPDALGSCWRDGVIHAEARVKRNGLEIGRLSTHGMQYSFFELIEHAARTRPLGSGTLISSGTISSPSSTGAASLIELRGHQKVAGHDLSPFLCPGDSIEMGVFDNSNRSLFGKLFNRVEEAK
jgi:fumarylacetoacetate (FAA) hydrolase